MVHIHYIMLKALYIYNLKHVMTQMQSNANANCKTLKKLTGKTSQSVQQDLNTLVVYCMHLYHITSFVYVIIIHALCPYVLLCYMHLAPAAKVLDKALLFMLSVRFVYHVLYVYY